MKLTSTRSKNSESFYITKSFRDRKTGRPTSKTVERLGTREELERKLGEGVDIEEWGRARARELTALEKDQQRRVMVSYDPAKQIDPSRRIVFGGGYLFLEHIYHELGLDRICRDIASRYRFEYDLDAIVSRLVYGRILHPSSKQATHEFARSLIERPLFDVHQIYRSLEVLHAENDFIQSELYKNSARVLTRRTRILYFDCTN